MPALDLTFIGSGNAFAPGGLCWNGFVVNNRFLFEAPPSALMALNQLRFDPNQLEAVVVSHHHGDHFLGLPFLFLHWKYRGRTAPVSIVGPPGTEAVAREIALHTYPGVFDVDYRIDWIEVCPGEAVRLDGIEIDPVLVKHDPKLSMSLGYLCDLDGRRLGYTGDAALCEGVLNLARRSEVLVSECASRVERVPVHMNLVEDIPVVREAMGPGAPLLLTHIEPDVDPPGLPHTEVARDYASYRF